ncbi:MAG TPA: LptF/LptG family permease [Synergistaceae bacterium]|nr:LptF/LptG family permease [Synergistaceae bacterium]HPJ24667.1 LptF/LptG family permease [Synergistaceae bacterium]HPQ37051.1 LptF/LptG family permease [Synergistaceae bacterium]
MARGWKILDRYMAAELVQPFIFGILAFTVIFVAGGVLFQIADLIIERGISMWVVIRLFLYRLPEVVALVIPMSSLLAALLAFGRLSGRSEIVAFRASGISFQRILRPVIFLSLGVVFLSILWNETVVPLSNRAYYAVMQKEVLKERPSLVKERVFLREESQGHLRRVIYIDRLKPRAAKMEGILVQEFDEGRLSRILSAEKGVWDKGIWTLEDGKIYEVTSRGGVSLLMTFESQKIPLELSPLQMEQSNRDPDSMGIIELFRQISVVSAHGGDVRPLWVSLHMRLAFPWATVVLALVGACLGVQHHRGGAGIGLGMSVLVAFGYYVVMSFFRALAQGGKVPVFVGAWLPVCLFLFLGGVLAGRANRVGR